MSHLHQANIELGGEWIETRLLNSGPRTNPWYQEASARVIENGDMIVFNSDLIGPHGYSADISRSCRRARGDQRRLGGFKWSSQHLDGSCDEHSKTALGSFWAGALVLTRSTAGGRARGAAAILGSDCGGHGE